MPREFRELRRELQSAEHRRELQLRSDAVDLEARTVRLAWASEAPYERWWGVEILSMTPDSVRMDRLRNGAAVLVNHDPDQHVGVVESASIDRDRVGRALVRFGNSDYATEILQDIADGVRNHVSVGYQIHDLVLESQAGDVSTYRVTDFQPYEISICSVPADETVGIGRAFTKGNLMEQHQTRSARRTVARDNRVLQLAATPLADREEFRRHLEALEDETGRAVEGNIAELYDSFRTESIRSIAGMWPEHQEVSSLAETIAGDAAFTVSAFRGKVLDMIAAKKGNPTRTGQLEADNAGYRAQYGDGAREAFAYKLKNFKSERNAYAFGMWVHSQMPGGDRARRWCTDNGYGFQRNINSSVGSEGGFLIPDELASELIRNFDMHGVARQEARNWPMSSLSLKVPTREAGLTATFGDEGTETNSSDPAFGEVQLNTKNVRCVSVINRETMQDSIVGMSDFILGEISEAFATLEDSCMFIGDGTSTYGGMTGLKNALAAGSKVDAASTHDTAPEIEMNDIAALMAALPQYAHEGAKFFCSMAIYAAVLQRLLLNAGGNTVAILEQGAANRPKFAGYDVVLSPVMPTGVGTTNYNATNMLYFGNARRAVAFGDRREVAMMVDPYTLAAKGQIRMIGFERFDCVVHGIGTASVAGPVIALRGKT